ncbi:MAG: hypothetical protein PHU06_07400 [Gallionella sp.]|nr:hypothetical protein [Gallionella sp.]MDD4959531.1 hypothetical protein [Gallionella sp.]
MPNAHHSFITLHNRAAYSCFALLLWLPSFSANAIDDFYVDVLKSGVIKCSGDVDQKCELSGVVVIKDEQGGFIHRGIVINDKPPTQKERSSVIDFDIDRSFSIRPRGCLATPSSKQATKFEDMTLTTDGKYAIATTAFDRPSDGYNMLVGWVASEPSDSEFEVVLDNANVENKLTIRELLNKAINVHFGYEVAYFKVEGLATLPDNRLIFGIREYGESYKSFKYGAILIESKYAEHDGKIFVDSSVPFKVIIDLGKEIKSVMGSFVGLSGMDYNAKDQRLYFLTSEEEEKEGKKSLNAYLWSIGFDKDAMPDKFSLSLANNLHKATFRFGHKAEGIAFLDDDTMLVVHDDDSELLAISSSQDSAKRRMNESVYTIIKLATLPALKFPTIKKSSGNSISGNKVRRPQR